MSYMELNRCSRCGCFYMSANPEVCPNCQRKDNAEFQTFKSYVQQNGLTNSLGSISNQTGILEKNLTRFLGCSEFKNFQQDLNAEQLHAQNTGLDLNKINL